MVSVNEHGLDLFEELVENADLFNVAYHERDNGARSVDCGVAVPGGFGAGDYFTRICMGGLGDIAFRQGMVGKFPMTFIDVNTDFPSNSCLGAQKAGWTVKHENFFAMGSGPARALSLQPKHTYEVIGYEDECDPAVICLAADHLLSGATRALTVATPILHFSAIFSLPAPPARRPAFRQMTAASHSSP